MYGLVISHLQRAYPEFVDPGNNPEIQCEADRLRAAGVITSAYTMGGCSECQSCKALSDRRVFQLEVQEKCQSIIGEIAREERARPSPVDSNVILDGLSRADHSGDEGDLGNNEESVGRERIQHRFEELIQEEFPIDCPEFHSGRFESKDAFRGRVISSRNEQHNEPLIGLYVEIDRMVGRALQDNSWQVEDVAEIVGGQGVCFRSREVGQQSFDEFFRDYVKRHDVFDQLCFTVLDECRRPLNERPEYNDIDDIREGRGDLDQERKRRAVELLLFRIKQALHARLLIKDVDYCVDMDESGSQAVVKLGEGGERLPEVRFVDGLHQAIEAKEHVIVHSEKCYLVKDTRSKVGQSTVSILTGHKVNQNSEEKHQNCPDASSTFFENKNTGNWVVKFVEGVSLLEKIKRFFQMIVYAVVWFVLFLVGDKTRARFYWGVMRYYSSMATLAQREVAAANLLRLVANPDFKNPNSELRMYSEYIEDIYVNDYGKRCERYGLSSRNISSACEDNEKCFEWSLETINNHIVEYKEKHSGEGKVLFNDCFEPDGNPIEKFIERSLCGDKDCLKLDNYLSIGRVDEGGSLDSNYKMRCCSIDTGLFGHYEGVEFESADTIEELLEMLLKRTWEHAAQYFGRPTMLDVLALADTESLHNALYNVLERTAQVKNRQIQDALSVVADPYERDRLFRLVHLRKAHAIRLLNTWYNRPSKGCWKRSIEAIKNCCFPWSPTGVTPNMMPGDYVSCVREGDGRRRWMTHKIVERISIDGRELNLDDLEEAIIYRPNNTVPNEAVPASSNRERCWCSGVVRMNPDNEEEVFLSATSSNEASGQE